MFNTNIFINILYEYAVNIIFNIVRLQQNFKLYKNIYNFSTILHPKILKNQISTMIDKNMTDKNIIDKNITIYQLEYIAFFTYILDLERYHIWNIILSYDIRYKTMNNDINPLRMDINQIMSKSIKQLISKIYTFNYITLITLIYNKLIINIHDIETIHYSNNELIFRCIDKYNDIFINELVEVFRKEDSILDKHILNMSIHIYTTKLTQIIYNNMILNNT
tara:strand:- start:3322 stop:3984 length:663 start_codon:yes stop_codon:yes gene_type:complete